MELKREWIEQLIFGGEPRYRFTQDSPILPEVWIAYARKGTDEPLDQLLTPHWGTSAGDLAVELGTRLGHERKVLKDSESRTPPAAEISYHESGVAARFTLESLVRVALPLTRWWRNAFVYEGTDYTFVLRYPEIRTALAESLGAVIEHGEAGRNGATALSIGEGWRPCSDLLWMIRVVGTLQLVQPSRATREGTRRRVFEEASRSAGRLVDEFAALLDPQVLRRAWRSFDTRDMVFTAGRNRKATPALHKSVEAVKADAARQLFNLSCARARLGWAVVDSGIDATHPAFLERDSLDSALTESDFESGAARSRVKETYDFTRVRFLLTPDPADIRERISELSQRIDTPPRETTRDQISLWSGEVVALESWYSERSGRKAERLRRALARGLAIDWADFEEYLRIPHNDSYTPPRHQHGTHVAGILAGDWRQDDHRPPRLRAPVSDLIGVCPDLWLYDLRVMDDLGNGDEFAVMAALQFVRHLNATRDPQPIHGVNLSLSIPHDVANFACGRTPVCEEARRLVGSGVVVVAAAGNRGFVTYVTSAGEEDEGYRSISITDPGNAEDIITVGSTHREEPHTYGVSYFSSRGPTGDGRSKPDLVAPGEKVEAPVPGGSAVKDGTSMAAPHVSGVAALLLARHREFKGEPAKVKEVLMKTATDLGREAYFQGSGLVDALRAIQHL